MAKVKTLSEAETARRRAVTGLHNLGRDDDADRIDDMDASDYAEEKGFEIIRENPRPRRSSNMARRVKSREELQVEVDELKAENQELQNENEELQDQIDAVAEAIGVEEEEEGDGEDEDENGQD